VYPICANQDIDRALYHTGRLPYDMFRYPQNPHALFLTHEEDEPRMTPLRMCDTLIELGNEPGTSSFFTTGSYCWGHRRVRDA
jgi:hypothetical protein